MATYHSLVNLPVGCFPSAPLPLLKVITVPPPTLVIPIWLLSFSLIFFFFPFEFGPNVLVITLLLAPFLSSNSPPLFLSRNPFFCLYLNLVVPFLIYFPVLFLRGVDSFLAACRWSDANVFQHGAKHPPPLFFPRGVCATKPLPKS